jgi:hypothetical protein
MPCTCYRKACARKWSAKEQQEVNPHEENIQGRPSCNLELRGRARQRDDHQSAPKDVDDTGYIHHASTDEPQYKIQSDKTDHIATHKRTALRRMND